MDICVFNMKAISYFYVKNNSHFSYRQSYSENTEAEMNLSLVHSFVFVCANVYVVY